MDEAKVAGMQAEPGGRIVSRAIERITTNRQALMRKMHPQLVGAARDWDQRETRGSWGLLARGRRAQAYLCLCGFAFANIDLVLGAIGPINEEG